MADVHDDIRSDLDPVEAIGFDLALAESFDEVRGILERIRNLQASGEFEDQSLDKLREKEGFALAWLGRIDESLRILEPLLERYDSSGRNHIVETVGAYIDEDDESGHLEQLGDVLQLAKYAPDPVARADLLRWLANVSTEVRLPDLWREIAHDFYGTIGVRPLDDSLETFCSLYDLFREDARNFHRMSPSDREASQFDTAHFRHAVVGDAPGLVGSPRRKDRDTRE